MPRAGFCPTCNANVWLAEDGRCLMGHPAEEITGVYEATVAPAPEAIPVAATTLPDRRFVIGLVITWFVVMLVLVSCAVAWVVWMGRVFQAPRQTVGIGVGYDSTEYGASWESVDVDDEIPAEWERLIAEDYPGWDTLDAGISKRDDWGDVETRYEFTLMPPGRTRAITVGYVVRGTARPENLDYVLRPASNLYPHADALLDYLDATYPAEEYGPVLVSVSSSGTGLVSWRDTSAGLLGRDEWASERIAFDREQESWGPPE